MSQNDDLNRYDLYQKFHELYGNMELPGWKGRKYFYNAQTERFYYQDPDGEYYYDNEYNPVLILRQKRMQQLEGKPQGALKKHARKKAARQAGENEKPHKKKSRFKRFLRTVLIILLVLSVYSVAMFFKGKHDGNIERTIKTETFNGVKASDGSTNILLLGSDDREGVEGTRTDTIMVLHLAPHKAPKLVSIMRDTFVDIPNNAPNKINSAYSTGGAELLRQTLKRNFDLDIQYYMHVNFATFEKIIDDLFPRGVKIDAEKSLNLDGVTIEKGEQRMNGNTLLQYARFRKDAESDFGRVRRQQQVVSAVTSQLRNPLTLLRLPYAAGKAFGYSANNLPNSFIIKSGLGQMISHKKMERFSIPGDGTWWEGYYDYAGDVLEINTTENKQALQEFLAK